MKTRPKTLALILAGGEGSRLEVLTEERAKPAMPYAGIYRLIDFPLSNCMHSGISDVWVVEQYLPHSLIDHLTNGRPWDLDRTYGGLRLLHPYRGSEEGGWHRGNADAIYRSKTLIRDLEPDILLVMSADHVYKLDYRDVIDRHLEREADVTMVTTQVPLEDAARYGVVEVESSGLVTRYDHKPEAPRSDLVTTEVFAFDAARLLDSLEALAAAGKELADLGHELLPRMVEQGRAYEHRLEGYWRDVGTVESYWRSHMELLEGMGIELDDPEWPIFTLGVQRPPARIEGSAEIEASLISPGGTVHGRVVRSVLGPGVKVEPGAEVRESVVLHDTTIRRGATVHRAVLDMGVRVGESASVGRRPSERDATGGADTISLIGLRASVPPGQELRAGARVGPGPGVAGVAEAEVR